MYSDETLSRNRDVSQVLSGLDNNGFSAVLSSLMNAHLAARAVAGARSAGVVTARAKDCQLNVRAWPVLPKFLELEQAMASWEALTRETC
ncbi:unnamed protein product [Fusarium graminearum]|uniref:Chromosome 3, complete genome n=1 Tax=Gibberella zeae (strain ATCC MYA-4620 / CBS 123657 / FGSC 9075 / NRRL 31084 / PH-1) TaxID=229533 RepID=A0A098E255_GIBZE|nr:unnamed protein product [Fusarium graminearum]CZS83538.1 unnamed protein product [Fusarium graminearum]